MPLFGVAPEAFSLLDAASSAGENNPPRAPPVPEAVHPENLPGCTLLRGVLTPAECEALIALTENRIGYLDVDSGKNTQGALTALLDAEAFLNPLFERCRPALPPTLSFARGGDSSGGGCHDAPSAVVRSLAGLNQRCRFYRYKGNARETFRPHRDDSSPGSGFATLRAADGSVAGDGSAGADGSGAALNRRVMRWDASGGASASLLTFLLYLNDDFGGGETTFFPEAAAPPPPEDPAARRARRAAGLPPPEGRTAAAAAAPPCVAVRPLQGAVLVFPQTFKLGGALGDDERANRGSPLHEGSVARPLPSGGGRPKYIMRSDVLYYF